MIGSPQKGKIMRSLRSGVATAAIVAMWSSTAFGFNLFSSDKPADAAKPALQTQAQPSQAQPPQNDAAPAGPATVAKTLAANLDTEIEKAKTQRALGDYAGAAHALAQLMIVAPDDPRVISEYGKVMVAQGHSDDAVAFLKRALELSPNDWTLYSAIGAAFDQKNEYDNARIAYQRGLQLKPGEPALLNNYAMSRMLAGDLPAAQTLIAQAQAAGNDPKIAHNAALMANLRGSRAEDAAPARPIAAASMSTPAPDMATAKPATLRPSKPAPVQAAIARPVAIAPPKPVALAATAPVAAPKPQLPAVPTPVTTAVLPPPAPVKTAVVRPEPVKTASVQKPVSVATKKPVEAPKAEPVKTASVLPAPVTHRPVTIAVAKPTETVKPAAEKTASIEKPVATAVKQVLTETPSIVKTAAGRVMMQAVQKDPEAGPVKTAEAPDAAKAETAEAATAAPRALASAVQTPHVTPELRAAAD